MSIRDQVQALTGLDLTAADIDRAVARRMAASGQSDAAAYQANISADEMRALVELLVVPESWMFRDADAFAAAVSAVQRRLAAAPGRTVRILSVPCAGGEEPYSMAMALRDAGVAPGLFRIEAFDLSEVALARARRGLYTRNAFRGGDLAFRERYFRKVGNDFQISDDVRALVRFNQGNLLASDLAAGGRYDVVFCRNLLIYFDEPTAATAIARLHALLDDDGVLFAGYAEVPTYCRNGFTSARVANAFALQKTVAAPPQPEPPVRAPVRAARLRPAPAHVAAPPPVKPMPPRALVGVQARPDAGAILAQARRQADQGNHAAAAEACKRLLETAPDTADAYFILGLTSECSRDLPAAEGYWRRCVYLKPDHYEALCHLALLAGERGDTAQSDALRQRAARVFQRANDGARKGRP